MYIFNMWIRLSDIWILGSKHTEIHIWIRMFIFTLDAWMQNRISLRSKRWFENIGIVQWLSMLLPSNLLRFRILAGTFIVYICWWFFCHACARVPCIRRICIYMLLSPCLLKKKTKLIGSIPTLFGIKDFMLVKWYRLAILSILALILDTIILSLCFSNPPWEISVKVHSKIV